MNAGRHLARPSWQQANRAEVATWIGAGVAGTLIVVLAAMVTFVLVTQ